MNCTARHLADCVFTLQRICKIINMHGYHSTIFNLFKASTPKQLKNHLMVVWPYAIFALHIGPYQIVFCFLSDVLICHMQFIYSSLTNNFFQILSRNSLILWGWFTSTHQVDCTSGQFSSQLLWKYIPLYLIGL